MYYRIYAKFQGQKKFSPLDLSEGTQVINLIYATLIPAENLEKAEKFCNDAAQSNKGLKLQIRDLKQKITYSI